MSEITLDHGGYFPSPLTGWYRERPFKVALAGSLLVHAMLIAAVPGFRAVAIDIPKPLNVEILMEEQPQPAAVPARPQPVPKPEIVPPPVVEQPVLRPELKQVEPQPKPAVRQPEPVVRRQEPAVPQPAPEGIPLPRTEVIQAAPRLEQKPEFTMPRPDPRPVPDVDPRLATRAEIVPESPVPRAAPQQTAPPVQPDIARATPVPQPVEPQAAVQPPPVAAPAVPNASAVAKAEPSAERTLTNSYEKSLSDLIKRHERYPDRARRQHWEGTVVVALSLSADGKVTNISVVESSGREILDEAALEMVRRASPLPRAPEGLRGKERSVRVPIAFKLAAS